MLRIRILAAIVFWVAAPTSGFTAAGRIVSTADELMVLELGAEDLTPANLFDLEDKTIRFTPDGSG